MPFAKKFRAMMGFPIAGDKIDGFLVESADVWDAWDEKGESQHYVYGVKMTLRGKGGKQGVKAALKSLFNKKILTFSGYGNEYQIGFKTPTITALGDKRYSVEIRGYGIRIYLIQELGRFLKFVRDKAQKTDSMEDSELVQEYLLKYRSEIAKIVRNYSKKLKSN